MALQTFSSVLHELHLQPYMPSLSWKYLLMDDTSEHCLSVLYKAPPDL